MSNQIYHWITLSVYIDKTRASTMPFLHHLLPQSLETIMFAFFLVILFTKSIHCSPEITSTKYKMQYVEAENWTKMVLQTQPLFCLFKEPLCNSTNILRVKKYNWKFVFLTSQGPFWSWECQIKNRVRGPLLPSARMFSIRSWSNHWSWQMLHHGRCLGIRNVGDFLRPDKSLFGPRWICYECGYNEYETH